MYVIINQNKGILKIKIKSNQSIFFFLFPTLNLDKMNGKAINVITIESAEEIQSI